MNQQRHRAQKLSEFPAHGLPINCLHIGRKSNGVLVTGGDDKTVKLWAIGPAQALMSFGQNTSPIQSVAFDANEELVLSGSLKGEAKVFDLQAGTVLRSFTAHRSSCTATEWSPIGGKILVTGSQDTNVKVWDLRTPYDPVQTIKSHNAVIKRLAISPNGHLLASGSEDGDVRVWDMRSNREHCKYSHNNCITGLQFHPLEFAMISSSMDKTIKFVDLDAGNRSGIITTSPEATGIRAITFCNEGQYIFSATTDTLKVWESDPLDLQDVVDVRWTNLGDLIYMKDKHKVLGCSFNQCMVGVWSIDLSKVRPWKKEEAAGLAAGVPEFVTVREGRMTGDSALGRAAAVQQSDSFVSLKSPGNRRASNSSNALTPPAAQQQSDVLSPTFSHIPEQQQQQPQQQTQRERPKMVSTATTVGDSLAGQLPPCSTTPQEQQQKQHQQRGRPAGSSKKDLDIEIRIPASRASPALPAPPAVPPSAAAAAATSAAPASSNNHSTATEPPPSTSTSTASTASLTDQALIAHLMKQHAATMAMLNRRYTSLARIKDFLRRGDLKGACSVAQVAADTATDQELVERLPNHMQAFTLELVPVMVPPVERLLADGTDVQVDGAISLLSMLLSGFGEVIRGTCAQEGGRGVDLVFEQRKQKCESAKLALQGLVLKLAVVQRRGGPQAQRVQGLAAQLQGL